MNITVVCRYIFIVVLGMGATFGVATCSANIPQTLYIESFGAIADGKTDCTVALEKALTRASQMRPGVTIQFKKGRYLLATELPEKTSEGTMDTAHLEGKDREEAELYKQCRKFFVDPCIQMNGAKGVTLAGVGSETELIVTCPLAIAFELNECSDIVFKDLAIDYDPVPFTQGRIVAVNAKAGTFDYKIDTSFPAMSEYWLNECDAKWGVPFDDERLFRMGGESAVFSDSWDDLGGSTWRMHLHYPKQASNLKVGTRFVQLARMGGTSAIFFNRCGDVKIENVHIYANGGTATIFFRCEGKIHVDGLQVRPRPGSGRIFSLCGDCVHCQSCRQGPLIENCIFEGMADDGMNFYTLPSVITEIQAPDRVRVLDPQVLRPGDVVQIIRPSTGVILVESVEVTAVKEDVITLARRIQGLQAGKNHVQADTIFNLSACGSGFVVRNNIIGGFRGRGVLARAHHGLVENNIIRDTSGQGIVIYNEPDWPEGPIPGDITVRNNLIIGVNRDSSQENVGAIQMGAMALRYKVSQRPSFKNVTIENNCIIDPPASAIFLQGVDGAVVKNNRIQMTANDRPLEDYYGVTLENCRNILVDDLMVADQWARLTEGIRLIDTPSSSVQKQHIEVDTKK